MKCKVLFIFLSLFSTLTYSQVQPVFSIHDDAICSIFEEEYIEKLNKGTSLSFETRFINAKRKSHKNWVQLSPEEILDFPLEYRKSLSHKDIKWQKWYPLERLKYRTHSNGWISTGIYISSMKPATDKSFIMQIYKTERYIRGNNRHVRVSLIDDALLESIIDKKISSKENPKEGYSLVDEGQLIYYSSFAYEFKNIFEYKGSFYILNKDKVKKIEPDNIKTVCKVGLNITSITPQLSALEYAANKVLLTNGDPNDPTNQPESYRKVEGFLINLMEKPWLLKVNEHGKCVHNEKLYRSSCHLNARVDLILKEIASMDPWSYREVEAIKDHAKSAKYVLKQFYIDEFKFAPELAQGMANQAVYDFLKRTVYLHPFLDNSEATDVSEFNLYTLDDLEEPIYKNWFNKTELMWAAHFNDFDAVQRLLSQQANTSNHLINDVTYLYYEDSFLQYLNRSALTYAAENATLPVIQSLINAGSDLNIIDSEGNSLEYYLAKNNLVHSTIKEIAAMPLAEIKPSFNCKLASTMQEKAICANKGLSVYDAQMAELYKKVRKLPFSNIKTLQRSWLKELRESCSMKDQNSLYKCMKSHYRTRIKYLNNLLAATKLNH